ncbi:MAG: hypothetical protein KGD63_05375 [Candidatus Lokiarchaeota archaeon]|nr:hypothetical protein [Candidatus Lokiarchaeota archaeon]
MLKIEIHETKDNREIRKALELLLHVSKIQLKENIINNLIEYFDRVIRDEKYKFKIFIACTDDIICGFVTSLIHPTYRSYGKICGTFGWLNCINSFEVCEKLLKYCENFIKENKIRKIRGNINFPKGLGGLGIQVEGFNEEMLYGVSFSDHNSQIPLYLKKLGYKPESEYICMEVTQKTWKASHKISKNIRLDYFTLKELWEKKEQLHDLIGKSFQGSFPMPDSSGRYRLEEIIKTYEKLPKSYFKIIEEDFDPKKYTNIKSYQDAWIGCDLEKCVLSVPIAFNRNTNKIIGACLAIPNLFQSWIGQPINQLNIDTVMVDKDYAGKGIFSALNNIGQIGTSFNGIDYFEGTYIWNKNPDAVKAIFPHGKPIRKHIVFQKRIK